MTDERDGVEVETPIGKFRARGTDVISVLGLLAIVVMGAILYSHMEDAKSAAVMMAATNKEAAAALKDSNAGFAAALSEVVKSQRLSTCILATDQGQREKEYMKADSFCNRVSK